MKNGTTLATVGMLVFFLAVTFAVPGADTYWTMGGLNSWYPTLRKAAWNPPNWVFAPVWTLLYTLMAVAAWLVWKARGWAKGRVPLTLYFVQLVLNAAWTGLFFAMRSPGLALAEILALWVAILATLVAFWRVDRVAGGLLVPYLLWVTYASTLNAAIWALN